MAVKNEFAKSRLRRQVLFALLFLAILGAGWFYPYLGFFIPACMVLGIGIALFRGRKWCDWFCPRGSFFDAFMKPVSPLKKIPGFFKGLPFRIGVITFLVGMMTVQIILRWPDPGRIGMFFIILLSITTVVGIILALVVHPRTWCSFCPIGSMNNWVDRQNYTLKIDRASCTECKLCAKVCPVQVVPYDFRQDGISPVTDRDCLRCGMCVSTCPKKALEL